MHARFIQCTKHCICPDRCWTSEKTKSSFSSEEHSGCPSTNQETRKDRSDLWNARAHGLEHRKRGHCMRFVSDSVVLFPSESTTACLIVESTCVALVTPQQQPGTERKLPRRKKASELCTQQRRSLSFMQWALWHGLFRFADLIFYLFSCPHLLQLT